MTNRIVDLTDIQARLMGKTTVAERVYRSRAWNVPDKKLPAVLLYAMQESGTPVSPAGHPQFRDTPTFSIQVLVEEGLNWDTAAMTITEEIKTLLFSDPEWVARWKEVPSFTVQQFVEKDGAKNIVGEVLTVSVERQRPTEYKPVGAVELASVATTIDLQTGAAGDAITLTQ